MNLAQAFARGLIAQAKPESGRAGLSLDQCLRGGIAGVRVHQAELPDAPKDFNAELKRSRKARSAERSVVSSGGDDRGVGSMAERICRAIRRAGRRLNWHEIEERADISNGSLGPVVKKLIARKTITRTGRPRKSLYGFPEMP